MISSQNITLVGFPLLAAGLALYWCMWSSDPKGHKNPGYLWICEVRVPARIHIKQNHTLANKAAYNFKAAGIHWWLKYALVEHFYSWVLNILHLKRSQICVRIAKNDWATIFTVDDSWTAFHRVLHTIAPGYQCRFLMIVGDSSVNKTTRTAVVAALLLQ